MRLKATMAQAIWQRFQGNKCWIFLSNREEIVAVETCYVHERLKKSPLLITSWACQPVAKPLLLQNLPVKFCRGLRPPTPSPVTFCLIPMATSSYEDYWKYSIQVFTLISQICECKMKILRAGRLKAVNRRIKVIENKLEILLTEDIMLESPYNLLFGKLALRCLFDDYFEDTKHFSTKLFTDDHHVDNCYYILETAAL
ncbi:hypothetical protein M8C21_010673 [Ambrosia artemisiifolia]|uniref:Uncharacterized protein n=1 Tax=Ambrosia artemisiifolia TaxID=4212 RepID=A0AAD5G5Y3_AMBAR|nr:hypothetical protein M8C21_010673 [Ambrosia artemisiifolia]